jgi:hypothetical protein
MVTAAADAPSTSVVPALKFNTDTQHPNDLGNMLLMFREKGYAIVSNVFERESVDAYVAQLKAIIRKGPEWYIPYEMPLDNPLAIEPARAPRLRTALQTAFAWEREKPAICLAGPSWLIKPSNVDKRLVHDWHKDGDHWGIGAINGGYHYPSWIHAAAYFTDMTLEHGPTFVIPRSHRDPTLSPFDAKGFTEEPFLPQKGDVVIWDQRAWHRGSARTVEGLRIMMNFAFFSVPIRTPQTLKPCEAVRRAYQDATDPQDKMLFGGPFEF